MHVAAVNPAALDEGAVRSRDGRERKRQIQIDIARESGKPEAVIEEDDRRPVMKKFLADITLVNQAFVINPT